MDKEGKGVLRPHAGQLLAEIKDRKKTDKNRSESNQITPNETEAKQIPDSAAMLRSTRVCIRTSRSDVLLAFTENCSLEPSAIQLNIDTDHYTDNTVLTKLLVTVKELLSYRCTITVYTYTYIHKNL